MSRVALFRCAPRWPLWLVMIALALLIASSAPWVAPWVAPWAPRTAFAQPDDDWQVQRDPFDKSVVARYKAILGRQPHDAGALAKLLELYRRYRSVDLLKTEYQAALTKKPEDWSTLVVLAKIHRATGDDATALELLQRATRARADDAAGWLLLGEIHKGFARTADARGSYEQALTHGRDKPTRSRALRALADLALAANDIDAANRYFKQFLEIDPKNAQLWIEHGDAMLAAKRPDEAVSSYAEAEKLLSADPARRVEVVARRGQALEALGRDEDAKTEYRRAIKLAPRGYYIEVELTARIIDIYRRNQELGRLVAEYERQWPEGGRGHFEWDTLGKLYEETGAQDKAILALKRAAAKAPWELETQRRLIQLLENSGRDEEALAQFEAVVRVAPGEARFQIDLIDRYWRRGLEKKALEGLRRLESRFPGDPGILSAIADLYQRYGKEDLAIAAYERLAKIEPDDPSHLVTLGEQYYQKGDKPRAMATWKRIANGKSAVALAKLGEVLAEHNELGEALINYGKAIKLEPKNPDFYKGRAAVQESKKAYNEALADWEEVLRLIDPKDRSARREARRRLVQVLMRTQGRELEYRGRWLAAFTKKPADPEAGYYLIEYYAKRPYAGEPQRTLLAMRTLVPDDHEVMLDLVKSYRAQRNYDAAVAVLLDIAKQAPHREHEIFNTIAEIKGEARLDDEAKEWAQKELAKNPNNPGAYQRIAELNVSMQRFPDAIAAYEKTISLDPRNTKSFFALAELYVLGAQPAKAIELYRRLLRSAPDEEVLARAGRKAIDLEEMTIRTLGELERILAPLAFMMTHKAVYRRVLVDLYLRYVPTLVERARYGSEEIKQASRVELTRIGEHGLRPLLEALRDEKDATQQKVAVSVLGHLGNKGAALPLVNLAAQEPKVDPTAPRRPGALTQGIEWELRIDALIAAGRLGDASILSQVVPLLSHGEAAMREAATFTLGRTGDRRALPHLVKALDDRRESVQSLACLGLAQVLDAKSAAAAIAVVSDGRRHDAVRAACAYALGLQRTAAAQAALSAAVLDNRGNTSRVAAWAIGQLGDERATPALIRAYVSRAQQDGAEMLWAIGRTLSAGLSPAATADLREYPTRSDRFDAIARATTLPGPLPALPIPEKLLLTYERDLGEALTMALSEHRDVALTVLQDLNAGERLLGLGGLAPATLSDRGQAALDRIGARLVPALERLMARDDSETRALAILALAKAAPSSPRLEKDLATAIHDGSPLVREHAMKAVPVVAARMGKPPASLLRLLREALGGPGWEDRRTAALALGQLGADQPVDALAAAAADASSVVREAVAHALGSGPAAALDPLLTLSADPVASVRAVAATSLTRHADERARRRLRELAGDPSPAVRAAAH